MSVTSFSGNGSFSVSIPLWDICHSSSTGLPLSPGFLTDMLASLFVGDFLSAGCPSPTYLPESQTCWADAILPVSEVGWLVSAPPTGFRSFLVDGGLLKVDLLTDFIHTELLYFTRCLWLYKSSCVFGGTGTTGGSYIPLFPLLVMFQEGFSWSGPTCGPVMVNTALVPDFYRTILPPCVRCSGAGSLTCSLGVYVEGFWPLPGGMSLLKLLSSLFAKCSRCLLLDDLWHLRCSGTS